MSEATDEGNGAQDGQVAGDGPEPHGAKLRGDWDLTPYFPEFDGEAYRTFVRDLSQETDTLARELRQAPALARDTTARWAELVARVEGLAARHAHLGSYLGCLGAANAADERIKAEAAAAARGQSALEKALLELRNALADTPEAALEALLATPAIAPIAYFVRRLRERERFTMGPALESLATDLAVDGLSAWGRLYSQVSGKLEFTLEVPGEAPRRLPIAVTRSFLEDESATVRRAAQTGANAAWESVADVTAACLNAISGTRLTLYERRGVEHFLDPALFDAGITRRTLETLLGVVRERAPLARHILRRKAQLMGLDALGFQDTLAPLPLHEERLPFGAAVENVLGAFSGCYPDLAAFAQMAIDRRWIDHTPRPAKRPGGFCTGSHLTGESRVFITYNGALGDQSTLAHELGHAFHGWLMRPMRFWQKRYPMTLAETASTFAEQAVIEATLARPDVRDATRAAMLNQRLTDAATFLLNIPMRFTFEEALYTERANGELSVSRLCELMCNAQREWFGDALDPDALDPWYWASKLHFYITGRSFYNFPYTFGYLFSLGIFARAKREGPDFLPRYEELLRSTGSQSAEACAARCLDVDLEQPDFWHASIDGIEADLAAFEEIAPKLDIGTPR